MAHSRGSLRAKVESFSILQRDQDGVLFGGLVRRLKFQFRYGLLTAAPGGKLCTKFITPAKFPNWAYTAWTRQQSRSHGTQQQGLPEAATSPRVLGFACYSTHRKLQCGCSIEHPGRSPKRRLINLVQYNAPGIRRDQRALATSTL